VLPDFLSRSRSLEGCPLSLVSATEELLGRNTRSSGSGLENWEYHTTPSILKSWH
jgi:hypothetical protein